MAQAVDSKKRDERVVLMMSPAELSSLDKWRHEQRIGSRAEAIRRLIKSGTDRQETAVQLRDRLAAMEPEDAAKEACGHPQVTQIDLSPAIRIHFTDGSRLDCLE